MAAKKQQQNGKKQQPKADWTIMVYIAADDVLANFAIESLKQLKVAAGNKVIVSAQLDVDGPFSRERIRRYVFDNRIPPDASLDQYIVDLLDPETDMVDPKTLTSFIDAVYRDPGCEAKHYALVLWGHGPELLTQSLPVGAQAPMKSDGSTRLYLTSSELAQALREALGGKGRKLDILALDTCSSSLAEIAAELPAYADFLVASQEDVPDMSFPYDRLLQLFRTTPTKVDEICKTAVNRYRDNYQNYIFGANTGTSKVSLSALELKNLVSITQPIKNLAAALTAAVAVPLSPLAPLVLEARKNAHGFVAGLFVDLVSFCQSMIRQLDSSPVKNSQLQAACNAVIDSFPSDEGFNGPNSTCVIANGALDLTQCHGLSIYFPFLTDGDAQAMGISLAKGGEIGSKGGEIGSKMRRQRITELEADYPTSALSRNTDWYCFIRNGWSRLLAQLLPPEELDIRYSAQQCTLNLLNAMLNNPCPPAGVRPPSPPDRYPKDHTGLTETKTNGHDTAH